MRAFLDVTFHHHAMALATALEFCAMEWRSPEIARQVDAMDGLGPPARRLDEVYATLPPASVTGRPAWAYFFRFSEKKSAVRSMERANAAPSIRWPWPG